MVDRLHSSFSIYKGRGSINPLTGSVQVRLNISGGYNGDLYGFLVLNNGPGNAATAILLNRIGQDEANPYGSSGAGFDVTLSDSGTTSIHGAPGGATGVWKPDGASLDGAFYGLATVNFTVGNNLKGGDIITVTVPPGTIESTDNAVTSADYLLLLNNYLTSGDAQ